MVRGSGVNCLVAATSVALRCPAASVTTRVRPMACGGGERREMWIEYDRQTSRQIL